MSVLTPGQAQIVSVASRGHNLPMHSTRNSYTVHAIPLEQTTATFKPTALRFDMISSTTVNFPVPAWPVIRSL